MDDHVGLSGKGCINQPATNVIEQSFFQILVIISCKLKKEFVATT